MSMNTLTQTTLAAAVGASDPFITLAASTGLSFTLPTILFCEGELMTLQQGIGQTTVSTTAYVERTKKRIGHASGATVYIGRPEWFKSYDPAGTATAATEYVTPWINTTNGNIWLIISGVYVLVGNAATTNAGVAASGVTAVETGNARTKVTTLIFTGLSMSSTTAAAKGMGVALYTLPAGANIVKGSNISMAVSGTGSANNASTPVVGLGTTIASGAVSVLSGTAAFQNIMAGQAAADSNGTPTVKTVTTQLAVETGDSHVVYANCAVTWAGVDAAMKMSGTVVIEWETLA